MARKFEGGSFRRVQHIEKRANACEIADVERCLDRSAEGFVRVFWPRERGRGSPGVVIACHG
jgi:ribulose bisphosphate carboxylase small subunit